MQKISILAFGNPLLDTIVHVPDNVLLVKYRLRNDDQRQITSTEMHLVQYDVEKLEKYNAAGGCAQNTLRAFKWLLRSLCTATVIGAIGSDQVGIQLKELMTTSGLIAKYVELDKEPTGTTIALIQNGHRALLAHLGAAECLNLDNILTQIPDIEHIIHNANVVYVEGFFFTKRKPIVDFLINSIEDNRSSNKITKVFNLSGEYLCQTYSDEVSNFASKCDLIFGNKGEFETLTSALQLKHVGHLIKKWFTNVKEKIIVITDGPNAIQVYTSENSPQIIPVPICSKVMDTTGAGDCFAGGFLAGKMLNWSIPQCAQLGIFAATSVIQQLGCTFPKEPPNLEKLLQIFKQITTIDTE